ncbi:MAG: glycogen synthase GlgA [Synechococcaceae cyanobacterium SM2_3_1]|nr:glycogen synthase GlgA [Synechococcaceae cyanobacterium SM2_3_1]
MVSARILFASAEADPLAKVGGMADVVGTLPVILKQLGHDIRLIMPFYGTLVDRFPDLMTPIYTASVMYQRVEVYAATLPNTDIPVYLVSHLAFTPKRVYGGEDEYWRFVLFANAVAMFAWHHWKPNIIHCHDWHTGLIPAWMDQSQDIGTVFTIHNLAYQGPWRQQIEAMTWLPDTFQASNAMAAGITYADQVNTVSPTYANEIRTPVHGEGLEGLLAWKGKRVRGILNGIDPARFDPATDPALKHPFSANTLEKRIANKTELQQESGLPTEPDVFLLSMVSRLVEQKGIDLLLQSVVQFLNYSDGQLVILGSGDPQYEQQLRELQQGFSGRVAFQQKFDVTLAQRIYGGADAFLMPSRFEPCGISQMIALRYGCVPIVRRTGGLVDTVAHHYPAKGTGTGYCFDRYEPLDLYTCMVRAWEGYQYKESWRQLQLRGMAVDHSWRRSALDYIRMYEEIMQVPLDPHTTLKQSDTPSQTGSTLNH